MTRGFKAPRDVLACFACIQHVPSRQSVQCKHDEYEGALTDYFAGLMCCVKQQQLRNK